LSQFETARNLKLRQYQTLAKVWFLIMIMTSCYQFRNLASDLKLVGGKAMLMKLCIAASVALGSILMVPGTSFAAGEQGKSVTADKAKPATAQHKKPKKGHADEVHNLPYYTGGQQGESRGLDYARGRRGQPQELDYARGRRGQPQEQAQ
jgi:hypothetical protein